MVLTQNITNNTGTLLICRVESDSHIPHGIENSSMYRFETVSGIRKSSRYYDRHGIVDVAVLHLLGEIECQYSTRPCDILFILSLRNDCIIVFIVHLFSLNIDVLSISCILLNELTSGFHFFSHQHGEDPVSFLCIL